ncbi:FUSC family protein [Agrobacterium vitis]|uniref:FUSC family protein n=1 Tax=Agrobacterium vitis TaxID=373 RepID=UPI0015DAC8AA|nr:FUSC family protein [Agrobacterium vitis]MCF1451086.1 aromatic acid exporter family protein [Agrobacterium vitis]BCH53915.1 FUSC family protein [Agrobacterium vitis]
MWSRFASHIRDAFSHATAAALAAAVAFYGAHWLFGHQQPIFAAIAAIICLAPGIPNHLRQGINVVIGVTIGIAVGELIFLLPITVLGVQISLAIFAAMFLGALANLAPVTPIQAGASALLVILLGPATGGLVRFLDVIIGVSTGLVFALILFRNATTLHDTATAPSKDAGQGPQEK